MMYASTMNQFASRCGQNAEATSCGFATIMMGTALRVVPILIAILCLIHIMQ